MGGERIEVDHKNGMWFFCVSVDGDDVRAELSLSGGLENGNFMPFIERIFILQKDEWQSVRTDGTVPDDGPIELTPQIARK